MLWPFVFSVLDKGRRQSCRSTGVQETTLAPVGQCDRGNTESRVAPTREQRAIQSISAWRLVRYRARQVHSTLLWPFVFSVRVKRRQSYQSTGVQVTPWRLWGSAIAETPRPALPPTREQRANIVHRPSLEIELQMESCILTVEQCICTC